jgi:RNA polymerase primary sigma factor|nr:MAG TPA: DNA directed RNA polymerase subunit [Caudoviricetes sp.]
MSNEELVARIKAGIDTADNMLLLWEQNKGMICKIARKYSAYADIEDLQQEGYLALYPAIDGFNQDNGNKFLSYATPVIDQRLRRYISDSGSPVRIPEHERVKIYEYKKMVNAFQTYLNRKPTRQEIARNMGLSDKVVRELEKSVRMGQIASLDMPLKDEGGTDTLIDMIPDENNAMSAVIDDMQQEELKAVIWDIVDSLPEDQRGVIHDRYEHGKSCRQIEVETGIDWGKVCRIENSALRALGSGRNGRTLRPFLNDGLYNAALHGSGVEHFNRTWTSSTERVVLEL